MPQSIQNQVLSRIYGHGRGWAFSQKDFAVLGSPGSIHTSLHRLCGKGTIRKVVQGIYDYSKYSSLLKQDLSPSISEVAQALARKFGWRIFPSGSSALNLMGLSTQVPARIVYLSSGPDRAYEIGNTKLRFRKTALKEATFDLPESGLIVQGLKSCGPDGITQEVVAKIRKWLPAKLRHKVLKDTQTATAWVYAAIREICEDDSNG
jgi:Family of unknown function (DUF6088)